MNESVTVRNRTSKWLKATWDGRPYDIPPYPEKVQVPRVVALAARFQNPVMGKGTPMEDWSIRSEYLLGIEEDQDPITPIEQTKEPQRWDTIMVNGENIEIVRARGGAYTEARQPQAANLQDSAFATP